MALVTVRIGGTPHTVGCKDGQEPQLEAMAAEVDRRLQSLAAQAGGVRDLPGSPGENRLLVLTALMLADQLHDSLAELEQLRRVLQQSPREVVREVVREVTVPVEVHVPVPDSVYAGKLASLAARAEEIAAGLERA